MSGLQRVFLGWNSAFLPNCSRYLLQEHGTDLSALRIALPGRRAGRRLLELLMEQAPPDWAPPQTTTLGQLSDQLTDQSLPPAPELLRDLTWVQVLQRQGPGELRHLLLQAPTSRDFHSWWPLANLVQQLHRDLGGAAKTFADAAALASPAEAARWALLTKVQEDYAAELTRSGFGDPHLLRLESLRQQRFAPQPGPLLLLGITEANPLQRQILLQSGAQGQCLIAAPNSLAEAFDELGMPLPKAWRQRSLQIPDEHLHLCADPAEQASKVLQVLREQGSSLTAEEVTLGVLEDASLPPLERSLAEEGIGLHGAQGSSLAQSTPARLLAALADYLDHPSGRSVGQLLRHADLEEALAQSMEHAPDPGALDTYVDAHVVERIAPPWLEATETKLVRATANLKIQSALLWEWCEDLRAKTQATSAWTETLEGLLQRLYGARELDRSREADRQLALALSGIGKVLRQWRQLPAGSQALTFTGADALRLLVHQLRQTEIAPPTRRGAAIDAVGWLELALDDAPALLLCDMQEGLVPSAGSYSQLLEAQLRQQLGLDQDQERLARDHFLLTCLCEQRAGKSWPQLFLCRTNAQGDPLLPSRLLFLGQEEGLAARALTLFAEEKEGSAGEERGLPPKPVWPQAKVMPEHDTKCFSPSRLNRYLESPYAYYLRHVLRLEEIEEEPRELNALHFGNLLHEVLEQFGRDSQAITWTDAAKLHAYLAKLLRKESALRFSESPRATVALQLEQAEYRLLRFAQRQAVMAEDGWRVHAVEWSPEADSVPLSFHGVDFSLRGRIDRIDRRERDGLTEWRIIDYKSGDKPMNVGRCVLARKLVWKDVQMALYPQLASPLIGRVPAEELPAHIQVCYWNLGASEDSDSFTPLEWNDDMLPAMTKQVADAVSGIRANDFFQPEQKPPLYDAFTLRCMGQGQLVALEEDEDEAVEG